MIVPVLAWIGFFSMLSQVLLMRELLVSFEGNELSLGMVLAAWLLWSGIGSAGWGVPARRRPNPRLLAGLLAASGLIFPATVVAASLLPVVVERTRGELAGPPSLVYPFLLLLPLCLAAGGLFPAASSVLNARMPVQQASGRVYLLEAFGGGLAGAVASFFLTGISPLLVAVIIGFANLLLAACLLTTRRRLVFAALFVAGLPLLVPLAREVDRDALSSLWKGYRLLENVSSPYGKLAVVAAEGEPVVFHDRVMIFGAADEQAVQERVHYPLLEHPAPGSVLLLGGGSPSALADILEHRSVQRLDFLEPDASVIGLFGRHFAETWRRLSSDPRVHIHETDARRFIRTATEKWDVIIVGLPPPQTVLMNRYYTKEFFVETRRVLSAGGIIALELPGAENYISEDLAEFIACIRATLSSVFPEVIALPGAKVQLFGSAQATAPLTVDPAVLGERAKERHLKSQYVRESLIPFRLTSERVRELELQTRPGPRTRINHDFAPVACYLQFIVWSSTFGEAYPAFFNWLARVPYWAVCLAATGLVVLPLLVGRLLRRDCASSAIECCVGAMGLTMLGLQIVLLLGFQASFGLLYQQIGLMTGVFMFGMSFGAFLGLRTPQPRIALPALQLLTCAWLAVIYIGFRVAGAVASPLVPYLLFAGLSVLTGLMGGWHFVVASAAWFRGGKALASLGVIYAVDLTGAALGAVIVAAFLLPVFGYTGTAGVLAAANLVAVFILLGFARAAK